MDFDHLLIFVDTSQTLNFSETAKRLHLSQPTVSKSIQALEVELNFLLFERKNGTLHLTDKGQAMLPWARQVLRECQKFQAIACSLHEKISGSLQIVCTTSSGRHILPRLAARFKQNFPEVQIKILVAGPADGVSLLHNQRVDLAVVSSEVPAEGLENQLFFEDEVILIAPASHPWVKGTPITVDDLIHEPIILREPSSGTRRALVSALAAHDIVLEDLNILMEIWNAEGIISAVASGLGVAFVSRAAAKCALNSDAVCEIPVQGLSLLRQIYMLRNAVRTPTRPAELFWGFVRESENREL
jgi:DNA-binding transcriptional LysR family regulator